MINPEPEYSPGATLRRMLILLLAALVMAFGIAVRADSVQLYDQIGVEGSTVRLGQIAELNGPAAQAQADLQLLTLEDGRGEYTITLSHVAKALDQAGVNWGLVSLRGFNECRVTRLAQPAMLETEQGQAVVANIETPIGLSTTLTLRGMVENLLADRVGAQPDEVRIDFSERDAEKLDVPILGQSIEVQPTALNTLGRVPVVVRLFEGSSVTQTIQVNANVKRTLLAVVTTVPITRGQTYTRAALQVRECVLDDNDLLPVTDPSIVIGQQATMPLRAGQMVAVRNIRPPILIKRGELVTVRCFIGGLIVRTVGIASQDGALEETISIKNESTGETFHGKVTGRQQVVVSINPTLPAEPTAAADTDLNREALN